LAAIGAPAAALAIGAGAPGAFIVGVAATVATGDGDGAMSAAGAELAFASVVAALSREHPTAAATTQGTTATPSQRIFRIVPPFPLYRDEVPR
jgi:hypothetical protein